MTFEDGAQSHRLVKVPVAEVAQWDATHDAVGRRLPLNRGSESGSEQNSEPDKVEPATTVVRVADLEK